MSDLSTQFDRLPPCDITAEMCTLASMILAGFSSGAELDAGQKMFSLIRASLDREQFFQADHQIIFDVLCAMHDAGKPTDPVLIIAELRTRGLYDEVGGKDYLVSIMSSVPSWRNGPHYAKIVNETAMLREGISAANDMLRDYYSPQAGGSAEPSIEIVHRGMDKLAAIITKSRSTTYRRLDEILVDAEAALKLGEMPGVYTGFSEVDTILGKIGHGENAIVAARPSMGKSAFCRQAMIYNAFKGIPAAIIGLEENEMKIARNFLALQSDIENHKLRKASDLTSEEWERIDSSTKKAKGIPLFIVDRARKLSSIHAVLSVLVAREGVQTAMIDHLGLVNSDGKNIYEKVSNSSNGLTEIIKELRLSGLILSQLNREVTSRDDKRPVLSDLRDSGSIEQNADFVLFIHREDYYRRSDPSYTATGIAEVIVAKARDAERGDTAKIKSNLKYQRFDELNASEAYDVLQYMT